MKWLCFTGVGLNVFTIVRILFMGGSIVSVFPYMVIAGLLLLLGIFYSEKKGA